MYVGLRVKYRLF